ncbi:NADH:flavin oxidoreductase [Saccharothrix sp. Mg75]|uniref:NADH:flavin oxidoreductase n=1 Tax=Saccharothrix sp. Mg75 TaxID=3445357 RepID=UPI003EED81A6
MTSPDVAPLFRPFELGALTLPNRVVMAPMTRQHSPGGVPGEDVAGYYARRAAGGVGLIITEGTYVDHPSAGESADVPRFHGEEALAGWARVAEAVHAEGGRIMPQLWHVGPARKPGAPPVPDAPVLTPSGLALDGTPLGEAGPVPTEQDLDAVVEAFADAAASAQRLGFDGVELHGAHGYLIDSFLWAGTNRRTDAYGGDAVARTRLAADVVTAVRKATGPDFPVVLRLSQWKPTDYDARLAATPQELEAILAPLVDAGVDVFHASTRRYWVPEFEGSTLNLAGWVKKITGRPVISVGSVGLDGEFLDTFAGRTPSPTGIDQLLERLGAEEFDLIAVGRALLSDPAWVEKVRTGRVADVTPFSRADLARLT